MEENRQSPKLLLAFVVDNCASMQDRKMAELMPAFRQFSAKMAENPNVEVELVCFDTFAPAVVKGFTAPEIGPVTTGKMPLLGRAINLALAELFGREEALRKAGVPTYRPWLFILSDGITLDAMEESVSCLEAAERQEKLMYLPFRLSPKILSERLQCLDRTKHMIEMIGGHIPDFFAFVSAMVERRAALPANEAMKFSKSDFEGWALL